MFTKEPQSPKIVSWHQDLTYWGLDDATEITYWVALSDASVASGCMQFVAGSHKQLLVPHHDADNFLPPLTPYAIMKLGKVALLPFFRPGDPLMGKAVRGLAGKRSAVMLANHGPVVAGKDVEAACNAIEELEATARLALLMRGVDAQMLDAAQITDIVTHFDVEWD